MTGATIGHYELLEKLGEGGMGVVYRARDLHLNRFAALKFLPAGAGLADDGKKRFLQEAQVASALNHPNIVTIYEIGLAPPHEFIAMEYVPGRTLDALIAPKGMPCREALKYAVQIAEALAAAHGAGIIHRDIKPGNVIVTDNGVAKVLDFGLAKLTQPAPNSAVVDATRTVAIQSSPRSVDGAIVGTVSYMSPEQAEGKPVDHRSDIFAFGVMLYEMLTAKKAFVGDSVVSTLAAILRAEPADLSEHLPDLPKELNRIVRRCLEKSPERRWQSMADVRAVLEDLRGDLQSGQYAGNALAAPAAPAKTSRLPWVLAGGFALVLAAASIFLWRTRETPNPIRAYNFQRLTSDASNVSPAISPDGKLIAYSSDRMQNSGAADIWIQQIAGGEPVRLTSGLGLCHSPSFSPDGSKVVFHGGPDSRGIYVVSTFGGEPRRVADGRGPEFSPDGSQIAYVGTSNDRITLVSALGGVPREIPIKHSLGDRPHWLPDGKRLLFLGVDPTAAAAQVFDWYTVQVDGSGEESCGAGKWLRDQFLRAAPHSVSADGIMINVEQSGGINIYRVPFDSDRARITGPPSPVTMAPGVNFWPSASTDGAKIAFGSAPSFNTNLWSLNIDSATGVTSHPQSITDGLTDRTAPNPSPDSKRLAYKATSGMTQQIRVLDLATDKEMRIGETANATPPVISDDGAQVAYAVREKDAFSIYAVPVTGGVPRRLCSDCGRPTMWLDRGTRILYDQVAKNTEIAVLDVATGKSTTLLRATGGSRIYTPRLSPTNRLLSFTRINPARQRRSFVVRFSEAGVVPEQDWKQATTDTSPDERQPVWSSDGRFLYFLSERDGFRCVWGVPFDTAGMKPTGAPFAAHHLHQYRHSLLDFSDVADIGLSVAGRTMYLSVREMQSNIWLADRKPEMQAAR